MSTGLILLPLISSSREVIENAIKSFFEPPFKSRDCNKGIRAHLLRAKSRIEGGYTMLHAKV